MLNRVEIIGNLGRDPEIRHTNAGEKVVSLSVATSIKWKKDGVTHEKTEWHRVVIFNQALAGVAEQYLRKGSRAYFMGRLSTHKWTDKQGIDRWTTEIVVPNFGGDLLLLDSKRDGDGAEPANGSPQAEAAPPATPPELDDDIPF